MAEIFNEIENLNDEIGNEEISELMAERYVLALERLGEITSDHFESTDHADQATAFKAYFDCMAQFLLTIDETYKWVIADGPVQDTLPDLQARNHQLYSDILPDHYAKSYADPDYAVAELGEQYGKLMSALYYELRSSIMYAFEKEIGELVIRMELFLEIYGQFESSFAERGDVPAYEDVKSAMYWFYSDYAADEREYAFRTQVDPVTDFARDIIETADLSDIRYLYRTGEYITENEIRIAEYLSRLPQERIDMMANTFTEGYRIGFEVTGKDIKKKNTASIIYNVGFERIIRKAVENLKEIGIRSSIVRTLPSIFFANHTARRGGYTGAIPNRQYDYDHKDDEALFLDHALINRKLEAIRYAGEKYKTQARGFGGPAVMEVFGEKGFIPTNKKNAVHMSSAQQQDYSEFSIKRSLLINQYIIGEERSFTIISFPVPEIGDNFEEIFDETIKINTLDYKTYQQIQQKLIDALDQGDHVIIKGCGENHTDMRVQLHKLTDASKQSNFENCVADVNIPVGEVFTSPVLKGTDGVLHVSGVYLEGLYFKNLEITFKDGCIADYTCSNFDSDEENRKYIADNILFGHKTLPLGEFAIGTNTDAYVMGRKFGIADKLPILIAEKTGPHFAVGDTCYSHEEENVTYNPDGKELIAKDNEISLKRTEDPSKAYFSCHTDITIPYDELGELSSVDADGNKTVLIRDGRFVLPGTEHLNKALDDFKVE